MKIFFVLYMLCGLLLCSVSAGTAAVTQHKLPVPMAERQYSVGDLLKLVQKNTAQATFMVPTTDVAAHVPVTVSSTSVAAAAEINPANFMGSASMIALKLSVNQAMLVALHALPAGALTYLSAMGVLPSASNELTQQYARVALFFLIDNGNGKGIPLFIVDPYLSGLAQANTTGKPVVQSKNALVQHLSSGTANSWRGLQDLLKRWDFTQKYDSPVPLVSAPPPVQKPAAKPATKPATKPAAKPAAKPAQKPVATNGAHKK